MPKISDIQETPNPNAVKFILREPISYGTSHSFPTAESAVDDTFAKSIFDVGNVVSVFYMDKMVTVEKTDDSEWDEILPEMAVPIRAAEAVAVRPPNGNGNGHSASKVGGAIAAAGTDDDPKLREIQALLDEKILPYLAGDGGWMEIIELNGNELKIRYQGSCGSCPSSISGTLAAIEHMLREEVDPDIEVIAI